LIFQIKRAMPFLFLGSLKYKVGEIEKKNLFVL